MDDNKVINLEGHLIAKVVGDLKQIVEDTIGFNDSNSDITSAIKDCLERNKLYALADVRKEKELFDKYGIEPNECHNIVCKDFKQDCDVDENGLMTNFKSYCATTGGSAAGCLFRMMQSPPNSLFYDGYMPSHQEALDRLQANGLLNGDSYSYEENQPRYGCPASQE
jgi:16S rRNA C1402 (ribose-2'-O) methylase RsmI